MNPTVMNDLGLFLAHSLTLEQESSERLREFADMMAVHNQLELAAIFTELASLSDLHANEVAAICAAFELPGIKPWEFTWPAPESPETSGYGKVRYEMSTRDALELMLAQEQAAADFYGAVAAGTTDSDIRSFASEFAEEERQHAHMLGLRLERLDAEQTGPSPAPDIDPPIQAE